MAKKKARNKPASPKGRVPAPDGCARVFASLSAYIDAETRDEMCADLEQHLGECDACVDFLQSLRRTVRRMEKQSPPGPAARLQMRRAILKQYRAALKSAAKPPASGDTGS